MNINYDVIKKFADSATSLYECVLDESGIILRDFLKDTIDSRTKTISPMTHFYRAQKGFYDAKNITNPKLLKAHPYNRMIPLQEGASEGRVNPKGTPCLYLADGPSPAIYEIRPWIGEIISVAHFISDRSYQIVDLTSDNEDSILTKKIFGKDLPCNTKDIERQIWSDLNRIFSKPVCNDSDALAPYAATQSIAEWFKIWGYDGLKFKSSVHPTGSNYAMFDINIFKDMESCELHTIDSLKYERHGTNDEFPRYCEHIGPEDL